MTRKSVREYLAAQQARYALGARAERTRLLDEIAAVTGYRLLRLHINFFQPVQRLHRKTRHGAILHRVFDRAQTPFQRLCASGILLADRRRDLEALYLSLHPLQLRREIDAALTELWRLAVREPALPPPPPPLQPALGVR